MSNLTNHWEARTAIFFSALFMAGIVAGCGTTAPPPTAEMAEARSAVSQAEDVGGMELAALEYRRAQQKLEAAQEALAREEHETARRLAEQAAVDAELASVKARSAKTRAAVEELRSSIRVLQEEMDRGDQ